MSHDRWRDGLRDAGADGSRLAALFSSGVPSDGLQLAGAAVLAAAPSTDLAAVIDDLGAALRQRGWIGDTELAVRVVRSRRTTSERADPDRWISTISRTSSTSRRRASRTSISSPAPSWPGELLDLDQGPDDFDPEDSGRWLLVSGEGSTAAYGDIERFIATVESEALGNRLRQAISGKAPFKAFIATLQRDDDQFTRWHRHRDDARAGRARHWLTQHSCPTRLTHRSITCQAAP